MMFEKFTRKVVFAVPMFVLFSQPELRGVGGEVDVDVDGNESGQNQELVGQGALDLDVMDDISDTFENLIEGVPVYERIFSEIKNVFGVVILFHQELKESSEDSLFSIDKSSGKRRWLIEGRDFACRFYKCLSKYIDALKALDRQQIPLELHKLIYFVSNVFEEDVNIISAAIIIAKQGVDFDYSGSDYFMDQRNESEVTKFAERVFFGDWIKEGVFVLGEATSKLEKEKRSRNVNNVSVDSRSRFDFDDLQLLDNEVFNKIKPEIASQNDRLNTHSLRLDGFEQRFISFDKRINNINDQGSKEGSFPLGTTIVCVGVLGGALYAAYYYYTHYYVNN